MVAINQNFSSVLFDMPKDMPKLDNKNPISLGVKIIRYYFKILFILLRTNKYLKVTIKDFDIFLKINSLDSIESIDKILMSLENLTQELEKTLQCPILSRFFAKPQYYLFNKLLDNIYSLQGLLTARQAQILKDDSKTSKI